MAREVRKTSKILWLRGLSLMTKQFRGAFLNMWSSGPSHILGNRPRAQKLAFVTLNSQLQSPGMTRRLELNDTDFIKMLLKSSVN